MTKNCVKSVSASRNSLVRTDLSVTMDRQIFELRMAGREVRYLLRDPAAAGYFAMPLRCCGGERWDVAVDDELLRRGREVFPPGISGANLEYRLLMLPTARHLLQYGICIVHAVAFAWRGLAWLLCGDSGIGKSTQFRRWRELCGPEVRLICGDMPLVSLEPDGSVLVSPSPWPGKERWTGDAEAPLGGVIFLEQAAENMILPLPPTESVPRMLSSSFTRPETAGDIPGFAAIFDRVVSDHPVWLLRNRGDPESAGMTMECLAAYLRKGQTDETI